MSLTLIDMEHNDGTKGTEFIHDDDNDCAVVATVVYVCLNIDYYEILSQSLLLCKWDISVVT